MPTISPTKPTWYVYDQFSFDPLAEFEFPNKEIQYRRVFNHPYSMETFSGETPELGPEPMQLGRYQYFYFNHRNDVTSLLKHNGQSMHSYLYDEYGQIYDVNKKPRDSSNFTCPHNHYTFSAKEFDEESQLSYFGARYYDSWSGTWGTQDSYRGDAYIPETLHRYGFVKNNPINLIDPYGYFFHKQTWQAVTDTTSAAAGFVKDKSIQAYEFSEEKTIQAYDYAAEAVDTGLTYAKEGIIATGQFVEEKAVAVKEFTLQTGQKTIAAAKELRKAVQEKSSQIYERKLISKIFKFLFPFWAKSGESFSSFDERQELKVKCHTTSIDFTTKSDPILSYWG